MESLKPIIKQLGISPARRKDSCPQQNGVIFPKPAMLHWRLEAAALKPILLTFGHQLENDPERFTRSTALISVRQFIRQIVESDSDG